MSSNAGTASGSASSPIVATSRNATLGTILVDKNGMTLYTLTNQGRPVPCTGACAAVWPPLFLPAGASAPSGGPGVTGLGSTAVPGGRQATVKGLPLYTFSQDTGPGSAVGESLHSFGGVWLVVKVTSTPTASGAGATSGSGSTGAGGGSRYGNGGY